MASGSYSNDIAQANTLALRTVMLTNLLDEKISKSAVTNAMTPNPAMVSATQEANKFKIATLDTQGLGSYSKTKGYPMGSTDLSWQEYTLRYDRARGFMLDSIDIMQTGGLASAGSMMAEFARLHVVPEIDSLRLAGCYERAVSKVDTYENVEYSKTISKANIFSELRAGFNSIFQNTHIETGLTAYVDAQYRPALYGSTEFQHVRQVSGAGTSVNEIVDDIDGNRIIWVPSGYMKTAFDLNDGVTDGQTAGGIKANAKALSMNFLITAPDTAYGIVSSRSEKYITRNNNILADADFMALRIYHDVIVPEQKIPGLYVSVKDAKPTSRGDMPDGTGADTQSGKSTRTAKA